MKFDLKCTCGDFNTTQIVVEAQSERGRDWIGERAGRGAVSFTAGKSALQHFFNMASDAGLSVQIV
jgi:hypothetical protein